MESHRKLIRQQVVDLLLNHTTVGERVFNSRDLDLPGAQVPCILVHTPEDRVNVDRSNAHAQARIFRNLELVIEVLVPKGADNYADTLDDLSAQVTEILWKADSEYLWICPVNRFDLESESMSFESQGDKTIGINRIACQFEYIQDIRVSEDVLDEFRRTEIDLQKIRGRLEL